jgi:hypothetical protein
MQRLLLKLAQIILVLFNAVILLVSLGELFGYLYVVTQWKMTIPLWSFCTRPSIHSHVANLVMLPLSLLGIYAGVTGSSGAVRVKRTAFTKYAVIVLSLAILLVAQNLLIRHTDVLHHNMADGVWSALTNDSRNHFQKEHQCCGYETITDR